MGGMPQDPLSALASALLRLTKTPLFFPQKGLECLDSEHPPLLLVLVVTEEIEKAKRTWQSKPFEIRSPLRSENIAICVYCVEA